MMLQGKTALITDGTSGIGFATARLFLKNDARVAITGRNRERLDDVRRQLGDGLVAIAADVRHRSELQRTAGELEAAFDELMNVNFKGVFFTVQAVLDRKVTPTTSQRPRFSWRATRRGACSGRRS